MTKAEGILARSGICATGGLELYRRLRERGPCRYTDLYDRRVYKCPNTFVKRLNEGEMEGLILRRVINMWQREDGTWYLPPGQRPDIRREITPKGLIVLEAVEEINRIILEGLANVSAAE
jgi:hypothetical protein